MVKRMVVAVSIVLFLSISILVQPAVSKEVQLPRGTPVTLKLPDDVDSITDVDKPLAIEVDREVVIDGEVVIKSGTPAAGRATMVKHPVQISVRSTETVDGQNVDLMISGEPMGTRVSAYTASDIRVNVP